MLRLIKTGKVKDVYEVDSNQLEFVFSNRISVFDKIIPSMIPHKGETLARTSAYWFEVIKERGILSHYIRFTAPNRVRVKRVKVIGDYAKLSCETTNYLIPLEFVSRYFVYGSLWDRVKENRIASEMLGFRKGYKVKLGEPLPRPFFEVTTKLEKVDRHLTTEEALNISGLSLSELDQIRKTTLNIDEEINSRVRGKGLVHVDGKKEFAFNEQRDLMVVDTFGTADEDRFWDAKELKRGKFVERSKEFVRQYYRETGYHTRLMEARRRGMAEPPIPSLPKEVVDQVSERYIQLLEDITDQSFR